MTMLATENKETAAEKSPRAAKLSALAMHLPDISAMGVSTGLFSSSERRIGFGLDTLIQTQSLAKIQMIEWNLPSSNSGITLPAGGVEP